MDNDFYDDIDVVCGDPSFTVADLLEFSVGDAIDAKTKNNASKKKNNILMVGVDDADEDSDEAELDKEDRDYSSEERHIDVMHEISQDVNEVLGNTMLNEPLEQLYREKHFQEMAISEPSTSKHKQSSKKEKTRARTNILNKAELRKEMLSVECADKKIAFGPKKSKNVLLKSLSPTATATNDDAKAIIEAANNEYDSSEPQPSQIDQTAVEKVNKWLQQSYSSEEEYRSAKSSPYSSSINASASASDNETPPRRYRATSKRNKRNSTTPDVGNADHSKLEISLTSSTSSSRSFGTAPTGHTSSDENVKFRSTAAASPSKSASTAPTVTSVSVDDGNVGFKKPSPKKKTSPRREIYVPQLTNQPFKYESADFPAIR